MASFRPCCPSIRSSERREKLRKLEQETLDRQKGPPPRYHCTDSLLHATQQRLHTTDSYLVKSSHAEYLTPLLEEIDSIREEIKKLERADADGGQQKEEKQFTLNEDDTSILYKGEPYLLTKKQAELVKTLDAARLKEYLVVSEKKILDEFDGERVRDCFRSRYPQLYGTLILKVKGGFRLNISGL